MAIGIMWISVLLVVSFWMICDSAIVELETGEILHLNCSNQSDEWTLLQDSIMHTIVAHRKKKGYVCKGPLMLVSSEDTNPLCRQGVSIDVKDAVWINISSVLKSDAGIYKCVKDPPESTTVVVVQRDNLTLHFTQNSDVGFPPDSNTVSEGSRLTFTCSIQYGGSQFPSMELVLRDHSGNERLFSSELGSSSKFTMDGWASISSRHNVSKNDGNFSTICRLPNINASSTTKTQDFYLVYGPKFTETQKCVLFSNNSVMLNCSVDASPSATYSWFRKMENGNYSSIQWNDEVINTTVNSTEEEDYQCMATNTKSNKTDSLYFNIRFHCSTNSVPTNGTYDKNASVDEKYWLLVGGIAGGGVLIMIIAIYVICILCKRLRRKRKRMETVNESSNYEQVDDVMKKPQGKRSKKTDPNHDLPATRKRELKDSNALYAQVMKNTKDGKSESSDQHEYAAAQMPLMSSKEHDSSNVEVNNLTTFSAEV